MQLSQKLYDQFSPYYRKYAEKKNNYIESINNLIVKHSKTLKNKTYMLDIGSGDGVRAHEIAQKLNIKQLTLLDNSKEMFKLCKEIKNIHAVFGDITQDITFKLYKKYDIATCLWNVLGHIETPKERVNAFQNIREVLSDDGLLFLDVNNRYNIKNYGVKAIVKNIAKDIFLSSKTNGEIDFNIVINPNLIIPTHVHIFNTYEIKKIIKESGFKIVKKYYIDYSTGQIKKTLFSGQLFFVLRK